MTDKIKELFEKYREMIMYLLFGGLTTVVSFSVYYIFNKPLGVSALLSNIISWVASVTFAFITNKLFVFDSKDRSVEKVAKEALPFYGCRLFSGFVETAFIWLTVDILGWSSMIMKLVVSVFVVIANYFFSKIFVFKKSKEEKNK